MKVSLGPAVKHFLKTTTLQGFKYSTSPYYSDRICWVLCCCCSACCAGALCLVLWARFLQVPALLTLHATSHRHQPLPRVVVCPAPRRVAQLTRQYLSLNENETMWLTILYGRILRKKSATVDHILQFNELLYTNSLTLPEMLDAVMPPCDSVVKKCRWQNVVIPCQLLFEKEMTPWGICCSLRPDRLPREIMSRVIEDELNTNQKLNLALQCSNGSLSNSCEFVTKYIGQEWMLPTPLITGSHYMAQVTFTSVKDQDPDKVVDGECVASDKYSKKRCVLTCMERKCGCSDLLQSIEHTHGQKLPPCPVTRLNCLIDLENDKNVCDCKPSCKSVDSTVTLQYSPMVAAEYTYDPMYVGLNATTSVVLDMVVRIQDSKTFYSTPTQTWLTLMSSLGGVFNMFLGAGLFSVLEILFFVFVKLPLAMVPSSQVAAKHVEISAKISKEKKKKKSHRHRY